MTGIYDQNGTGQSQANTGSLAGTYLIGADNNGMATITVNPGNTTKWAFATTGAVKPAQQYRMVEMDDTGSSPSGQHGTANCYLATTTPTTAFAVSTISGKSFAFGMQGENGNRAAKAIVGRFTAGSGSASGGAITGGIMDGMSVDGTGDKGGTATGTYTAPDSTTGRFKITLNPAGGSSTTWEAYIIDANRMFVIETAGDSGLLAGDMRMQQQSGNTAAALLNGPFVVYEQGLGYQNGRIAGYGSTIMRGTGNGAGSMTVNASYDDNNGTAASGDENGTYTLTLDSANTGRTYFSPGGGGDTVYLYFFNVNTAFFLDLNGNKGNLSAGWVEAQKQTTFSDSALAGSYLIGEMPAMEATQDGQVGVVTVSSSGSITGNMTKAGQGEFRWDQSQTGMSYNWLSTTYGTFSVSGGGGGGSTCMLIGGGKVVCIDNTDTTPGVTVLQQ
jgi:hypothetical protein